MKYLQKVKCTGRLRRKERKGPGYLELIKEWVNEDVEFEGVIIGKRSLSNGIKIYDEIILYEPTKVFTVFLVSVNMRENPVYVLPENIE